MKFEWYAFTCGSIAYCLIVSYILGTMRRSALAESLLHKYQEDEKHRTDKHPYWYQVDVSKVDSDLQSKFVQLDQDEETQVFLDACFEKSDWFFYQLWHSLLIPFLKMFMTQTNVNGYLDRGSMFVFSTKQFQKLVGFEDGWRAESLLDLGAGDGKVTVKMSPFFERVYTTEAATQMQKQLEWRGFDVLGLDEWRNRSYDVISCLNLLDRCDRPVQLLNDMRLALKPDGFIIVASVSPYAPYVELNASHEPSERLAISSSTIEGQINEMVRNVFQPSGFELHSFSRVPYLCEGDLSTSFYTLHDIIFVLKPQK